MSTFRTRFREALRQRMSRWHRTRRAGGDANASAAQVPPVAIAPPPPEPRPRDETVAPAALAELEVPAESVATSAIPDPASYVEAPAVADVVPAVAPPVAIEIVVPRAPGRFETDADLGMRGKLYDAPHKRRGFVMYVPAGWSKDLRAPLIVLCHGCKQTPEEFAKGSRIADLADRLGCLVLMPRQTKWANPWRCWNWFDPTVAAGEGEAEMIAAQIRYIRQRYRADKERVVAAGISAGAALAAVLGLHYPRHVRAVISTAGLACGAAASAISASDVMRRGPNADFEAVAVAARAKSGGSRLVPLLAIHGDDDTVVAPANSAALVRQYLRFNGHPSVDDARLSTPETLPAADSVALHRTADGRDVTTREWRMDGHLIARLIGVAGLGHAWSGGDDALAFNDARAPDATQLVGEFMADVFSPSAEQ